MRARLILSTVVLFVGLSSAACSAWAAQSEKTKDWMPLFNGKDLTGWTIQCLPPDRDKVFWKVVDGASPWPWAM